MADAPPPNESSEDYAAAHALEYKNRGNAKFKEKDYEGAVQAFSEAIALDPSNAVLYSNRSGAYLAMSHVSKAFKDAEEAVRLDPTWPKALARRATAEHALTRFITAQATWRKALQLDPGNEAYEKALQAAKDGEALQTKERIEDEKRKEREAEEKRRRDAADEAKRREDARNEEQLKDFFGVLEDDKVQRARKKKLETNPITEKYQKQKLGKGADHVARSPPCGSQISGAPRHRRDVVPATAAARWRGGSRHRRDGVPATAAARWRHETHWLLSTQV